MNWLCLIRHAFESVGRHRLRSSLSSLGVVFAVVAVITMVGITEGTKRRVISDIEGLGTNNIILRGLHEAREDRGSRSAGLFYGDAQDIKRSIAEVKSVAVVSERGGRITGLPEHVSADIIAVDENYAETLSLSVGSGRFLAGLDFLERKKTCILGTSIARSLGPKGTVGSILFISGKPFRVVGILEPRDAPTQKATSLGTRNMNDAVLLSLGSQIESNTEANKLSVDEIIVRFAGVETVSANVDFVHRVIGRHYSGHRKFQTVVPVELLRKASDTQNLFTLVMGAIAGISLIIGGIGIANLMLANVAERTREVGIRRAIGGTQKSIVWLFLTEALLLSVFGLFCGIVLGISILFIVGFSLQLPVALDLWVIYTCSLITLFVGITAGIYPAWRASQLDPVEALRH